MIIIILSKARDSFPYFYLWSLLIIWRFFNAKRPVDGRCQKVVKMFTQKDQLFTAAVEPQKYCEIFKKQMDRNRLNQVLETKENIQKANFFYVVCQKLMENFK